jgi:hypothetical protein
LLKTTYDQVQRRHTFEGSWGASHRFPAFWVNLHPLIAMRWLQLRLKMVIFCGENAILCRPALAVNSLPYFCLCEHVGNLLVAHLDPIFVKKSLNFTDIKGTSFIGVQDGKHPVNYVV